MQWTIRKVLEWTAKDLAARELLSPRLDAELIIAHALGLERIGLYLEYERPLETRELASIRRLVERRRAFEPIAYLLGYREFYGRRFSVDRAVLIPRPETEGLVEKALERLDSGAPGAVLDLCTGSGAIAITLATERPELEVWATDLSEDALKVARGNAASLGVESSLRWFQGDLWNSLSEGVRFPLVVSNPPYILDGELEGLQPDVSRWEPRLALAGGEDGLELCRRILARASEFLQPGGTLLMEIGQGQSEALRTFCQEQPGIDYVLTHPDLAGIPRVFEACRQAE